MKIIIVQEIDQYTTHKVPNDLVTEFKKVCQAVIVVEENSIAVALAKFESLEKPFDLPFNSELIKYKSMEKQTVAEEQKNKQKLRMR